ncbi:hypothetical protein IV38_GL001734 [Lactobacillus selangorensis]|uniref:HAD superfamily hydrolase n=1 Tax=Lactobacillus selangorensis TaxID=81857 RepID=A0A0R2FZH9_9LACO|nr:sugar-phosphatase [Lactobacillus selangorensis]KRN27895.1 hypothetical protein IV38_GL001734 [Lactobacillus selangorensis]KRN30634.1 hypothetical protein IV40_GL001821 [Lactobacillus selangorensis]
MTIKLIATDMDETLLNEHSALNPLTIETIKQARQQGVYVVLATGRPLAGVAKSLQELGLTTENDFVITYNGALVQNSASGKVIVKHTLNYDDYLDITYMARKVGVHLHAEDEEAIYTSDQNISRYTVNECQLVDAPLRYRAIDQIPKDKIWSKLMMIDEPKILKAGAAKLPDSFKEKYNLVNSQPYYLEVLNKKASKGNGLRDLAAYLNIPMTDVMALGDQANDLSMIEAAGLGVAMGNAIPAVKQIAQAETATNVDDGVARAIQKYVLK